MAKGGWSYAGIQLLPHTATQANWEADYNGVMDAVASLDGWSVSQTTVLYAGNGTTDTSFWGACEHTSGALLIFDWKIHDASGSPAVNNLANVTMSGFNARDSMGIAYFPPGNSGVGAANPATSGFIPNDGFRFGYTGYDSPQDSIHWDYTYNGTNASHTFHFVGKGDDIFILLETYTNSARWLDYFWGFGTLISQLAHEAQETSADRRRECTIGSLNGISGLNASDSPISFWRTPSQDGGTPPTSAARVRVGGAFMTWSTTPLASTVYLYNEIGDEPYVGPILYYSRSVDIDSEGIIRGNGLKGALDTDKIRIVQGRDLTQRQTLDNGNFMYIGGGVAIGWDPGNGPTI
jgi:hypothetical protein